MPSLYSSLLHLLLSSSFPSLFLSSPFPFPSLFVFCYHLSLHLSDTLSVTLFFYVNLHTSVLHHVVNIHLENRERKALCMRVNSCIVWHLRNGMTQHLGVWVLRCHCYPTAKREVLNVRNTVFTVHINRFP